MLELSRGRYRVRAGEDASDIERAQRLRHRAFRNGIDGIDSDGFDPLCRHVLIEDRTTGRLAGCFRLLPLSGGREIRRSYAAQFYELSALEAFRGPMVELGRFCIDPDHGDPDVLRLAWGALTAYVDREEVELLFGCASFAGTDACAYRDAFTLLTARHIGPRRWRPRVKAAQVVRFAQRLRGRAPDPKAAMTRMPPLLRTYLLMGGWVSDHAVIDRDMNTLHVFTGVEVERIPPARKRLLRAVAG